MSVKRSNIGVLLVVIFILLALMGLGGFKFGGKEITKQNDENIDKTDFINMVASEILPLLS